MIDVTPERNYILFSRVSKAYPQKEKKTLTNVLYRLYWQGVADTLLILV